MELSPPAHNGAGTAARKAVALNGRFSGTLKPTGTQIASFQLFNAIIRGDRQLDLVVFADPEFPGVAEWADVPRTRLIHVPFSTWKRSTSQLWEQFALPTKARAMKCGLVHHPMTTCSRWKNSLRQIITVHDMNFHHHPEWVARSYRLWLEMLSVPAIRRADHVATISDYVLADVRRTLGIPVARSSRIYNGVTPLPVQPRDTTGQPRIILGLNLWQPHKNLPRLLGAFSKLRPHFPDLELHLVGRPQTQFRTTLEHSPLLNQPGVRVLGYLSNDELAAAYSRAEVVCYPSLEEGFGLPILEAMVAGVPVVTSNASCLPEVAGGAAILVDPEQEESIAAGVTQALEESADARSERIARGRKVAARFSWSESARNYLALYERLA